MDSSTDITDITVLIYHNSSIISNTDGGVTFMFAEQAYFAIPQTMSFGELNAEICESINADTEKGVVKIRYRCLISIINENIKYRAIRISAAKMGK